MSAPNKRQNNDLQAYWRCIYVLFFLVSLLNFSDHITTGDFICSSNVRTDIKMNADYVENLKTSDPSVCMTHSVHIESNLSPPMKCERLPCPKQKGLTFIKTKSNTAGYEMCNISTSNPCGYNEANKYVRNKGCLLHKHVPVTSRNSSSYNCVSQEKFRLTTQHFVNRRFESNANDINERIKCKLNDCVEFWRTQLSDDIDKNYILNGITYGFDIMEGKSPSFKADMPNYRSITAYDREQAELLISNEIDKGNYKIVDIKPTVISSLGAVPKSDGSIRLIHDLSRPFGGINAFVEESTCSYNTIELATNCMPKGCYLSKLDLKAAYRSVPICPKNFQYTGLSWVFSGDDERTFFVDTKLPFGAKKACRIFSRISDSIARMLSRQGVKVINYLDDMLIISRSKKDSWLDLDKCVNMLTCLGFEINWSKVEPPTQNLSFLGVQIDTVARKLSLPPSKLNEFIELVDNWSTRKRVSKKELQHFLGKLNWAARVIRGGHTFMRRLIDLVSKLKSPHHRIWLNCEARAFQIL